MSVCDILTPARPPLRAYMPCGRDAVAYIAHHDGTGGMYACGSHRDSAIILLASRMETTTPLMYTPVGTHAAAIERARAQSKER